MVQEWHVNNSKNTFCLLSLSLSPSPLSGCEELTNDASGAAKKATVTALQIKPRIIMATNTSLRLSIIGNISIIKINPMVPSLIIENYSEKRKT